MDNCTNKFVMGFILAFFFWAINPVLAKTVTHKTSHHHAVHSKKKSSHHHVKSKKKSHHVQQQTKKEVVDNDDNDDYAQNDLPWAQEYKDLAPQDSNDLIQNSALKSLISSNDKTNKPIADLAVKTVETLQYSKYRFGGKRFDPTKGVYVLDCSNFVDHLLEKASPNAYSSLVDATGANTPASFHYYNFFSELSDDPDNYWNKVDDIAQLQPGDILVFRYKNRHGFQTGGHVMVVMNKPVKNENVFMIRVADSAPSGHSEDTRPTNTSGIGIGTLLLKASEKTGKPSAFAWGLDGYWNRNVNIAMARPVDTGQAS